MAATTGPGLVGSLLVGVSAAKALSLVWGVPFVAVNHLEAHLYASFLEEPDLELPLVVLLVSGGHTMLVLMEGHGRYRLLGSTLDDAAGEAYDKVARYLGLGYPGGPAIDALAMDGDPTAYAYPRSMVQENPATLSDDRRYAFSFSGLKTAVVNHVRNEPDAPTADVAASFQEAVVDAIRLSDIAIIGIRHAFDYGTIAHGDAGHNDRVRTDSHIIAQDNPLQRKVAALDRVGV